MSFANNSIIPYSIVNNFNAINNSNNEILERLNSGLRINKMADDASGMLIADSLKGQYLAYEQSLKNSNDTIAMLQIADRAISNQVEIVEKIKVKAVEAAQDSQTLETRKMLQQDIVKLLEELDNIALTTQYNGNYLLSGDFTNRKFQIGAYSNEDIDISIMATTSQKIGNTRFEFGNEIKKSTQIALKFKNVDGIHDVQLESVVISHSVNTGIGVLTDVINKNSTLTGIKASWEVEKSAKIAVLEGEVKDLKINNVLIGNIEVASADNTNVLVNTINYYKNETGVFASKDSSGRLILTSLDGRGIKITAASGMVSSLGFTSESEETYGRLRLVRFSSRDIVVTDKNETNSVASAVGFDGSEISLTLTLKDITKEGFADSILQVYSSESGTFTFTTAGNSGNNGLGSLFSAAGGWFGWGGGGSTSSTTSTTSTGNSITISYSNYITYGAGVTTTKGAMIVMDLADSALNMLNKIRGEIGSAINRLEHTSSSILTNSINHRLSESGIRDSDFAEDSFEFVKNKVLQNFTIYAFDLSKLNINRIKQLLI